MGVTYLGNGLILQWPVAWYHADILKDITFLEMISIALSVFLWDCVFKRKKIAFHVNLAVVSVELEVIQISKSNAFVEVYCL